MAERLDMLPANKQIGFFSDAYCVEWTYAKAMIVRKQMAAVFAQKISQGQYSVDDALYIARQILFDSPQSLLGMKPGRCPGGGIMKRDPPQRTRRTRRGETEL